MNRQPYTIPPQWWPPKLTPSWVRWTRPYRRWQLRTQQKIVEVQIHDEHHLLEARAEACGILITPNHSAHYDSSALYLAADQLDLPLYFMTAWQVFGMSSAWQRWAMQRLGCFSIDRESADRKAYKQAVDILQNEPYPLVIFPEGDIYHVTDRVTPFREGAAAIAISAARRAQRPILVVPCAIKFWYVEDPTPRLHELLSELEERLLLRPDPSRQLPERIHRFAEALLALKEIEYRGLTQAGSLSQRIAGLAESILDDLESRHGLKAPGRSIPERVKNLRQRIIQLFMKQDKTHTDSQAQAGMLSRDMEDLFVVMQLYSYPGDYLLNCPSVERIAETLDKFEEDVLQKDVPSVRGRRRVDICFGTPRRISAELTGQSGAAELSRWLQSRVQELLDQLNSCDAIPDADNEEILVKLG